MKLMKRAAALFLCLLILILGPVSVFAQTEENALLEPSESCAECAQAEGHAEDCSQYEAVADEEKEGEGDAVSGIPKCPGAPVCFGADSDLPINDHQDSTCTRKEFLKSYVSSNTAEDIAAAWQSFTEDEQSDILIMLESYNQPVYDELMKFLNATIEEQALSPSDEISLDPNEPRYTDGSGTFWKFSNLDNVMTKVGSGGIESAPMTITLHNIVTDGSNLLQNVQWSGPCGFFGSNYYGNIGYVTFKYVNCEFNVSGNFGYESSNMPGVKLSFENCKFTKGLYGIQEKGPYLVDLEFNNCEFINCAPLEGGCLAGDVSIINCKIGGRINANNLYLAGGNSFTGDAYGNSAEFHMENCTFSDNVMNRHWNHVIYLNNWDSYNINNPGYEFFFYRANNYPGQSDVVEYKMMSGTAADAYKDNAVTAPMTAINAFTPAHITYDGNGATGGTSVVDTTTYAPDSQFTVLENGWERTGYRFVSWNTKADGTGTTYIPGEKGTYSLPEGETLDDGVVNGRLYIEAVTLYAQWEEVSSAPVLPSFPDQGLVINKTAEFDNRTGMGTITLEAYVKGEITSTTSDVVLVIDQSASMWSAVKQGEGGCVTTSIDKDDPITQSLDDVLDRESAKYAGYYACYERDGDNRSAYLIRYYEGQWQRSGPGVHSGNKGWEADKFIGKINCPFDMDNWIAIENPNHYCYFKTISGALYDALYVFADSMQDAANCRVAVATFAGDPNKTTPPYDGSGIFVDGVLVPNKAYTDDELRSAFIDPTGDKLYQISDKIKTNYGYTPTGLGLRYAEMLLTRGGREDANKIAIVFTDGNSNSDYVSQAEALKGVANEVYCIGPETGTQTADFMTVIASDKNHAITAVSEGLDDIFEGIAGVIVSYSNAATSSSVIKDTMASSFKLPTGATADDIKIYTEDYTGSDVDGEPQFDHSTRTEWRPDGTNTDAYIDVDKSTDTVEVKGFEFENNPVISGVAGGKKLIIRIPFVPIAGFLGGDGVPTNDASSGVYNGNVAAKLFNEPEVDVNLVQVLPKVHDDAIYISQETDLSDIVDEGTFSLSGGAAQWTVDGRVNKYVNIEYTVKASDGKYMSFIIPAGTNASDLSAIAWDTTTGGLVLDQALDADEFYTITSKVTSVNKNTNVVSNSDEPQNAAIKVFKPVITYKDSVIDAGDDADYEADNFVGVLWKNNNAAPTDDEQLMLGEAPELEYVYDPAACAFMQETPVQVIAVNAAGENILEHVVFKRQACTHKGCSNTGEAEVNTEGVSWVNFTVHVGPVDLTIHKTGWNAIDENQSFMFRVTKGDFSLDVLIAGNGFVTIKNLPAGEYTVTELTDWSWRYGPKSSSKSVSSEDAVNGVMEVTFTNKRNVSNWLSGDSYCENWWGGSGGGVLRRDKDDTVITD